VGIVVIAPAERALSRFDVDLVCEVIIALR
jgi:hypothetical protein